MTYNEPITRKSSTLGGQSILLHPWNGCVISARVWTPGWTLTSVMWSSCTVKVGGVAWLSSSQPSWITATSAQGWLWLKTSATIQMLLLWTSAKCHCLLTTEPLLHELPSDEKLKAHLKSIIFCVYLWCMIRWYRWCSVSIMRNVKGIGWGINIGSLQEF